jgi:hypothetical protein
VQRLSIIVPLTGDLKRLEDTLVSVLENQPQRSEVVVVLNEPYDDPYQLRGEVKFVEAPRGADLADCLACGLAASEAPIVHTIAGGVEAMPGWADAALARFSTADVAAVAPLVVDRKDPRRILSAGLRWTTAGSIARIASGARLDRFAASDHVLCGPELAAAFYRRDVLEAVESLQSQGSDLAAATELGLAIRQAGFCAVQEPACVTTATRDLLTCGGAWREGVAGERLFRRWTTVPGWKRSWAAHAALVGMECLQSPLRPSILARLAGRCWAALGFDMPRTVAGGSRGFASREGSVLCPAHFGGADARRACRSRAAG